MPENGTMKYRLDSGGERIFQGVVKQGNTYYVPSFTTCTINDKNAFADLYLRLEDDGRMAVKAKWIELGDELGNTLEEVNTFFNLPVKYNEPITPR